jgi:hypothetical protein
MTAALLFQMLIGVGAYSFAQIVQSLQDTKHARQRRDERISFVRDGPHTYGVMLGRRSAPREY